VCVAIVSWKEREPATSEIEVPVWRLGQRRKQRLGPSYQGGAQTWPKEVYWSSESKSSGTGTDKTQGWAGGKESCKAAAAAAA
jgi:hypothetical protein